MNGNSISPEQADFLTASAEIARFIAVENPVVDYTPAELDEARAAYSAAEIESVEREFCEFETFYVMTRFFAELEQTVRLDDEMVRLLYRSAKRLDKGEFRANPYLAAVKIPTVKEGKFTLTESRYAKGEIIQCDMPDFTAAHAVPKLGFFSSPVRFPTIYEGNVPWMSVIPSEIRSMQKPIDAARGRVLVLGLGLGYYPFMISLKEEVEEIVIVERAAEVKKLFEEHLLPQFPGRDRITVVRSDAFDYLDGMERGRFDFCFADIWEGAEDGVPLYGRLKSYESRFPETRFSYWIEDQLRFFME